ncbi:hypothetical protein [Photobacterium leiognathi]|uniref:hypothetical protein n=1 Tax=Photobacterium leiognathi TaxID=553611 RepID=UPI002738B214|nr:hypothetical protein [Photobacterium leiognathi]
MKENLLLLDKFIDEQKRRWDIKNKSGKGVIDWDRKNHQLGCKGDAWLHGNGSSVTIMFDAVGKINNKKVYPLKMINTKTS